MNRRQFLGTVGTASITSGLTAFSLNQISENETQGEVKQIATDKISVDIVNLLHNKLLG